MATTRFTTVDLLASMEAIAFKLPNGRVLGLLLERVAGLDQTPVIRVALADDGETVILDQLSGNRQEWPAHVILQEADPGCFCPGSQVSSSG